MKKGGHAPRFAVELSVHFVDELPDPLGLFPVPELPVVPPMPDVAPGAEAGDSVLADGLLGAVVLGAGAVVLLGALVLGVVVVLEGLLLSSLPQP